ncbi:hypothetical protein ACRYKS_23345 [Escherichia coli]|uniref:hypothetical protein n=1 Tax=Escherichia coli TaxID=562 RepID=UPI003D8EA270
MKTELVKIMYATHTKLLLVKMNYNRKHNEFCTLIRNEESFTLRTNDKPMLTINDFSGLDTGELFQESLVLDSSIHLEIEVLQQYQILLNRIMENYPCEVGGPMQFKSKMYEL